MGSLGERLKRTRENRKLTLDQAATATKISTRMLNALEEEKFEQLPGGIFNKGFVRSYAKFLGIDENQAVNDYLQASAVTSQPAVAEDAELKAIAERKEKERERQRVQGRGMPWGLSAAVLLLIALSLAIWGFYSREGHASGVLHAVNTRPQPATVPVSSASAPAPQPTLTDVSQSTTSSAPAASPLPATQVDTPAAGSFTVQVDAKGDSWLTVTADGKQVFSDILVAPATKSFSAQKEITVRAGNAGGVDIAFDGQKVAPIGEEGEVKTVTFGPSGLQVPSPKPSE